MDPNIKILIVDDMQTMRRILKSALSDIGFNDVTDTDGGESALPMLEQGNYDLLITDWNMPGMEGIDLLKAVRASDKLKAMPAAVSFGPMTAARWSTANQASKTRTSSPGDAPDRWAGAREWDARFGEQHRAHGRV